MKKSLTLFALFFSPFSAFGASPCGSLESQATQLNDVIFSYTEKKISREDALEQAHPWVICLSESLRSLRIAHEFVDEKKLAIQIQPSQETPLGEFAARLKREYSSTVKYDFLHFLENPFASGSYRRSDQAMLVRPESFRNFSLDDPLMKHEMLHVKTWHAMAAGAQNPFFGWMRGSLFQPNDLWLDEMLAYGQDTLMALADLQTLTHEEVQTIRFREILSQRLAGKAPLPNLSSGEKKWDQVCKKLVHRGWHTEPALTFLQALSQGENEFVHREEGGLSWMGLQKDGNIWFWPSPKQERQKGQKPSPLGTTLGAVEEVAKNLAEFKDDLLAVVEAPIALRQQRLQGLRLHCESALRAIADPALVEKYCKPQ